MGQPRLSRKKRVIYGPANQEMRPGYVSSAEAHEHWDDGGNSFNTKERLPKKPPIEPAGGLQKYSIARPLNFSSTESRGWFDFLQDVEERNGSKGTVKPLGQLVCRYVSGEAMEKMLADRFSSAFDFTDKNRARRFLRDYAANFNLHMRTLQRDSKNAAFEQRTATLTKASDLVAMGGELILPPNCNNDPHNVVDLYWDDQEGDAGPLGGSWQEGVFAIKGICKSSPTALGAELRDNDFLQAEWQGIKDYLRHDRLDLRLMSDTSVDPTIFKPSVEFFEGAQLGGVMLKYTAELPSFAPLHPPSMRPDLRP